jgi:microcystin-dependent protein
MKKILTSFLMLAAGVVFASQPLVQGEMDISSYTEQNVGTQYRIVGEFRDLSVVGFTGADIAISNLVFTETVLGDCDAWRITNVVAAGAVKMTVDVIFAQSGSSTVGMVAGYAALASLSTNSVGFPQIPSPEFCHLSGNLLSQIRNYSFTRIQSGGGGSGTLTNEVDPVWGGVSNLVVYKAETNGWTVLPHAAWITNYDESDPVWAGKSNTVVYTNNAKLLAAITNETYLGTITGATIAASSANAVTITGPNAAITWDTNAAGGGGIADLSGWSGVNATQQITWAYSDAPATITNLLVTGSTNPLCNGTFVETEAFGGERAWYSTNLYYATYADAYSSRVICLNPNGSAAAQWSKPGTTIEGGYTPEGATTGNVTVAFDVITYTNVYTWKSGAADKTKWSVSDRGTNLVQIYPESNVFTKPIYGNGANLTGITPAQVGAATTAQMAEAQGATNALNVRMGNAETSTNAINTVANNALPKTGGIMTGPVSNNAGYWGDGGGLTNLAAPTATNSDALGNISAADWSAATNANNILANAALPKTFTNAASVVSLQVTGLSGNGVVPVGAVMQYISSNAPAGWLVCQGQAVSTSIYANLFAVIGTQYGGATTNMNLPDLRNRVAVGLGSGSFAGLNAQGGYENVTLTTNQMPAHSHTFLAKTGSTGFGANYLAYGNTTPSDTVETTSARGGGLSHPNMPPYLVLNYIIKF